jgi:hypothetical protein
MREIFGWIKKSFSRRLSGTQYKTAFVLAHKLHEALGSVVHGGVRQLHISANYRHDAASNEAVEQPAKLR